MSKRRLSIYALVALLFGVVCLAAAWAVAFFYGDIEHPLAEWLPPYVGVPTAPIGGIVAYFVSGWACILIAAVLAAELVLTVLRGVLNSAELADTSATRGRVVAAGRVNVGAGGVGVIELPVDASDKLIVGLVRFALADGRDEFKIVVRSPRAGGAPLTFH